MPFGRGGLKAPKHVDTLASEFDATQAAYADKLSNHAADAADRHAHVNTRLAALESEASRLQELRDRIAAA